MQIRTKMTMIRRPTWNFTLWLALLACLCDTCRAWQSRPFRFARQTQPSRAFKLLPRRILGRSRRLKYIYTALQDEQEKVSVEENLRHQMSELEQENQRLLDTVHKLQVDNENLIQTVNEKAAEKSTRLVLETFEGEDEWCDELESDGCPIEPSVSFGQALRDRAAWLVGLLLLQSFSGIILSRNEALIADHPFIVYFLTMLVGAGGNAGNQASVRVIRGLALGTLNPTTQRQFLLREFKMAVALSSILTVTGFARAIFFATPLPETMAVTTALFLICFSSICLGAVLPLGLKKIGVDPAHSSTSIQVIMDILGVLLAVSVSSFILDSPIGGFLMSKLSFS